ncbi:MAG: hypothetical protein E7384_01445, partial [Ruminococcaceae bacterium]|nr:hypothetical protein [Oscillospiraceae bacterium]
DNAPAGDSYQITLDYTCYSDWDDEYEGYAQLFGGLITVASASTGGGEVNTPVVTDPEVTITTPAVVISNVTAAPGDTFEVTVKNVNFPEVTYSYDMELNWDSTYLTCSSVVQGTAADGYSGISNNTNNLATGKFKMAAMSATEVNPNGLMYTMTFTVADNAPAGDSYQITLDYTCYSDWDDEYEGYAQLFGGLITVASASGGPDTPAPTYTTTVNNGTATPADAVVEGTTVTITADPAATGMVFDGWTVVSGGVTLADATAESTTFTMGTANVEVTANYKAMAVDVYVTDGTYTGTAAYGETITIIANNPPAGHEFDKWVVTAGGVQLADETAATTTFTMGTEGVAVKASYKKVNYTVSICPDIEGGAITAAPTTATMGETVTVTLTPDSGKKLSKLYYTIDGDTTEYAINTTLKTFTMPAADVEVHAEFADITGITITGDYRGEAGDLIFTGDTNVDVTLTVTDNADSIAAITFTLDIEDGLTTGTPVFTPATGLEILAQNGNTYTVWAAYAQGDITDETFVLGTVTVPVVTAKSSANDAQYKVSITVDDYQISNATADAVDVNVVDGTVFVSKTIESIKFFDKTTGEEFTTIEVDETEADKDGFVADYINNNVEYVITYTDGTSDDAQDASADMFADLTTDVTDDMTGGQQATITGAYTQEDTQTTVTADVVVTIALNESIVGITVTPDTLYFKVGDTFAWGNTQYTLEQANSGTVGPNAVSAGVQAGTLVDDSAALDNTSTAAQTVTVTYAEDQTVTDTVTVYFVAPTIVDASSTQVYYEEGAAFDAAASEITLYVSYNENTTGIADEEITTGFTATATLTLAADAIAATAAVEVEYEGATFTIDDAVVVVDFAEFGKVLVGSLTADATVTDLLKLSNYGTALVTTDLIAVRNIAVRAN